MGEGGEEKEGGKEGKEGGQEGKGEKVIGEKEEEGKHNLPQLGGNISLDTTAVSGDDEDVSLIPVYVGNRPLKERPVEREPVRRTVRRNSKLVDALSVPRMTLYNMRSAWSKLDNLAEDMRMRKTDLCVLTEVWQVAENVKHQEAIEELLELHGVKYVSTPRPGARRGGGTALACSEEYFHMSKLNIAIPKPLEACFTILRPKKPTGKITKFICCSFYSPPRSPHRNKLAEFLVDTLGRLRQEHPGSRVILAGDRNDLRSEAITDLDPTLKQLVKHFTNKKGDKVLDVILTDCRDLLQEPSLLPPLQVDDNKKGEDSDHKGVQCLPRSNLSSEGGKIREKIVLRRFPESKIIDFGIALAQEDWRVIRDEMNVDEMVNAFVGHNKVMVDRFFQEKVVQVGPEEKPFFTEELRSLKRRRQRAYAKYGRRSAKYSNLKKTFDQKLKHEARKYVSKVQKEIKEGKRGSGYKTIRKLGNRPGESWTNQVVTLPTYVEQNLSHMEVANKLAQHFSVISQSVDPLDIGKFHPALKTTLQEGISGPKPTISQHEVYRNIIKVRKPNSSVSGDIPRPLIKKYPFLYAAPISKIFNNMIQSGKWPRQWVREEAIVLSKLEKTKQPTSEDDLRSISKTAWVSKLCENMLGNYILPIIDKFLDPGQCGGLKKSSISHYLVKLLDFIHTTLDERTPHAAVLATEDLSKAYNRGSHQIVIEDLHAMLHGSPHAGWILNLTCSYLQGRSMILTHQQARSSEVDLPGGFSAGTWLGGMLFIVKFNGACLRPPVPRPITGNKGLQLKFVDDSTQVASVNLKKSLEQDLTVRPRPLNCNERTQMKIINEENILQQELNKFQDFCTQNKLVINSKKCFAMLFSRSKLYAFPPEFNIGDSQNFTVKRTHRIL